MGYSHSGDVFTREGIGGVANQQTGLTHSPEEVTTEDPKLGCSSTLVQNLSVNRRHVCVSTMEASVPFQPSATQTLAYIHVA